MRIALLAGALLALVLGPVARAADPVVQTSVAPGAPRFGDTVTYTVSVSVPTARADRVTVATGTGVLTRVAAPRTARTDEGELTRITVTEQLACVVAGCVTGRGGREVTIPAPRVRVAGTEVTAAPTRIRVRPRVPLAAVGADDPAFRRPSTQPEVTSRVDPRVLEAVLVAAAVLLVLGGIAGLVVPLARRRTRAAPVARGDALRRAVRLLRESAARGTADRRRAASHAGRVVGAQPLASDAARIAWSRPEPVAPDLTSLADRVERSGMEHV